jgi:tetratricopeptide (TPR) repeat protein
VTGIKPKNAAPQSQDGASAEIKFHRAVELHQQGQLFQAETLYREVLALAGDRFDALHMLGVIEAQRRNPKGAIELIDRALQLRPASVEALPNRGVALEALGR